MSGTGRPDGDDGASLDYMERLESQRSMLQSQVEQDVLAELTRRDLAAAKASREADVQDKATVPMLVVEDDIYRDSLVRLLGYANEVGEALRPLAPSLVLPSYAVAWAYVALDTADKAHRSYTQTAAAHAAATEHGTPPPAVSATYAGTAYGVDTLLWQGFASVLIPGYIINRFVAFTGQVASLAQARVPRLPAKALSTAVGLATIPFLVAPLDDAVHGALDKYVRPRMGVMPHAAVLAQKWAAAAGRGGPTAPAAPTAPLDR